MAGLIFAFILVVIEVVLGPGRRILASKAAELGLPAWTPSIPVILLILLFALFCTVTTQTVLDPKRKAIRRTHCLLFLVPFLSSTRSFGQVRYVNLRHGGTVGGDSSPWMYFLGGWWFVLRTIGLLWGMRGHLQPIEVVLFMENRDQLVVKRAYGEAAAADLGTTIARMTGSRLG